VTVSDHSAVSEHVEIVVAPQTASNFSGSSIPRGMLLPNLAESALNCCALQAPAAPP
jgi:hypothetical protein